MRYIKRSNYLSLSIHNKSTQYFFGFCLLELVLLVFRVEKWVKIVRHDLWQAIPLLQRLVTFEWKEEWVKQGTSWSADTSFFLLQLLPHSDKIERLSKKKDNIHVYSFMFHILLFSCKSFKNDFLFFGYRLARRKKFIASSYSSRNLLQECLLLKLPQDVLFHIMQYLNRVDICTLAQVIYKKIELILSLCTQSINQSEATSN
jgi:hypothetical protein